MFDFKTWTGERKIVNFWVVSIIVGSVAYKRRKFQIYIRLNSLSCLVYSAILHGNHLTTMFGLSAMFGRRRFVATHFPLTIHSSVLFTLRRKYIKRNIAIDIKIDGALCAIMVIVNKFSHRLSVSVSFFECLSVYFERVLVHKCHKSKCIRLDCHLMYFIVVLLLLSPFFIFCAPFLQYAHTHTQNEK